MFGREFHGPIGIDYLEVDLFGFIYLFFHSLYLHGISHMGLAYSKVTTEKYVRNYCELKIHVKKNKKKIGFCMQMTDCQCKCKTSTIIMICQTLGGLVWLLRKVRLWGTTQRSL